MSKVNPTAPMVPLVSSSSNSSNSMKRNHTKMNPSEETKSPKTPKSLKILKQSVPVVSMNSSLNKEKKRKKLRQTQTLPSSSSINLPVQLPMIPNFNNIHPLILNNPLKYSIFQRLKHYDGIESQELIDVLLEAHNMKIDDDSILLKIVMKKQEVNFIYDESQADKDLEQAIINSEGDREFEEKRKRERLDNLLHDCTIPILQAIEFSNSLLLIDPSKKNDNSCKINGCSYLLQLAKYFDGYKKCMRNHGEVIVLLDDDNNSSNESFVIPCECNCSPIQKSLRKSLVRLLLLEKDAIRYYRELSHTYIAIISETIENTFLKTNNSENGVPKQNTIEVYNESLLLNEKMQNNFDEIIKKFEFDLYHLSTSSDGIPDAFREAELQYQQEKGESLYQLNIDTDGVELIKSNNVNTSTDMKPQSWEDISDYASDSNEM